jgi:hypothetical protein
LRYIGVYAISYLYDNTICNKTIILDKRVPKIDMTEHMSEKCVFFFAGCIPDQNEHENDHDDDTCVNEN